MAVTDAAARPTMTGAVGAAYAVTVRIFVTLLVPTGVVLVPGAVVAADLFFGWVGREAVLTDDGFRPLFTSSAAVVGTAMAIAVGLVARRTGCPSPCTSSGARRPPSSHARPALTKRKRTRRSRDESAR